MKSTKVNRKLAAAAPLAIENGYLEPSAAEFWMHYVINGPACGPKLPFEPPANEANLETPR